MSTRESYGTLFPTAVVGSMPRPEPVRNLVLKSAPLSDTEAQALDAAIDGVIALQERVGLDVITDGEWRRASYIGVIAELAHGFEKGMNPADGRPWTIVIDRLSPANTGFIASELRYLKASTHLRIKATLPSPALLGERMWDPVQSAGAYPDPRDFVRDCVPILRREAELLRDEGVDLIQIDDPHLCLLVDETVRASYSDPDEQAAFAVDMVNDIVSDIPGVRFAVHLCRRAGARVRGEACHTGGYGPILPFLNKLKVQHLTMEFTSPGAGDAEVFQELRDDFEIGLGCLGVHPGEVDTAARIVERVEQAMEYLPKERIVLNPDCGFAPGSAAQVDIGEVEVKLGNMVEAARVLRERHG